MSVRNRFKRLIKRLSNSTISLTERQEIEKQLGWEPLSSLSKLKKEEPEEQIVVKKTPVVAKKVNKHAEWKAQHKIIEDFYAQQPPKPKQKKKFNPVGRHREYMNQVNRAAEVPYSDYEDRDYNTTNKQIDNSPVPAGHKNTFWFEYYMDAVEQFKDKNRKKIYYLKSNDPLYTEKHHIKPKCIGGTDDPDNFVIVNRDEHTTLHILLFLSYPTCNSLYKAASYMVNNLKPKYKDMDNVLCKQIFKEAPTQQDKVAKMKAALLSMIKRNIVDLPEYITKDTSSKLNEDSDTGVNYY